LSHDTLTSRDLAVTVSLRVERGAFADVALHQALRDNAVTANVRDRATALAYGAVRLRNRCDYLLAPLLSRRLNRLDALLRAVLRVGAFELLFADPRPPEMIVDGCVELAKTRGHAGLASVANAVLRQVAAHREQWRDAPPDLSPESDLVGWLTHWASLPPWLAMRWASRWGPTVARELGEAANVEPALCLRVEPRHAGREEALARLRAAGYHAEPGQLSPHAVMLSAPGAVTQLPGWDEGWYTVQDEAAMCLAPLSGARPGDRVIDLCAAPGGKAMQLAAMVGPEGRVVAVDRNPERLARVEETARRLGVGNVELLAADARELPGRVAPADVILLDAPCSGSGTLARRADVRWRLGERRLAETTALQRELLSAAALLLRPGGVIVYATCSLEREENEGQMEWLAETHPELTPDGALSAAPDGAAETPPPGWDEARAWATLLPAAGRHDGFFVARRRAAAEGAR
jgi:16S rRNA (cytosine967-C5)-methyltransferase